MTIPIRDRRNMEPRDEFSFVNTLGIHSVIKPTHSIVAIAMLSGFKTLYHPWDGKVYSLRVRGGGNNDMNNDSKYNDIPALTKLNFQWNGLPCIDFDERVLNVLNAGLGSISSDGDTLLDTCLQVDAGGVLGAPPRAAASAKTVQKSMKRNKRAFACILNYILATSAVYKMFWRDFRQNGIAVYDFIRAFGPLPVPPRILRAREDAWSRMSMDTLRLPYDINGYMRWCEIVREQARKLGKDAYKQKDKFVEGLPAIFNTEKTQMRHDVRFLLPATYGGLLGFAGAPNANVAHPFAGQPDIEALSRAYIAAAFLLAGDFGPPAEKENSLKREDL